MLIFQWILSRRAQIKWSLLKNTKQNQTNTHCKSERMWYQMFWIVLSEAHNSSFFFISAKNLCPYPTFPTPILDLPEVLIRKLLRPLFLFPSITMTYCEWKKPGETTGNVIRGMRTSVFLKRRTSLAIKLLVSNLINRKYFYSVWKPSQMAIGKTLWN